MPPRFISKANARLVHSAQIDRYINPDCCHWKAINWQVVTQFQAEWEIAHQPLTPATPP